MYRQCRKCKRVLEVNSINFDENKNSVTGYQPTCKRCSKNKIRINKIHNGKTAYPLDYEMFKSHNAVYQAVKLGILPNVKTCNCDVCLIKQATEYHHWSYLEENRLSVIPVCKSCHTRLTNIIKRTTLSRQIDTPTHDNVALKTFNDLPLPALPMF